MTPSRTTALTEDLTKSDWSPTNLRVDAWGKRGLNSQEGAL